MLIYHDGNPGSGKSYETVVKHILPALSSGRQVYAFVEGLNHAKIAELIEEPVERVQQLLIQVERDQVPNIHKIAADNSLVVIDELQNFWPSGKQKLDPDITQFVTEHRHRGIDIIGMGQDYRDAHALFKRRIERKVSFMNLDVLGREGRYKWVMYKAISGERFEEVSKGVGRYDPKYFGTYLSYVNESINDARYADKRAVLWNSTGFKVGAFVVFCGFVLAPIYLTRQFNPETSSLVKIPQQEKQLGVLPAAPAAPAAPAIPVSAPAPGAARPNAVPAPAAPAAPADYVAQLSSQYRVRLVAVLEMTFKDTSRVPYAVIEFRDSGLRVQDRFDSAMLMQLGWRVEVMSLRIVKLSKPGFPELIATAWPIESFGQVSDSTNSDVKKSSGVN